jgi:hypothetical protein
MLYVPFALGVLVAGRVSWALLWLLLGVTALFFARESLIRLSRARRQRRADSTLRRTLALELGMLAFVGVVLVVGRRLYGLLPIGAAAGILLASNLERAEQREERGLGAELLAVLGLAMTAPAAHYTALGAWHAQAVWLWGVCLLYFASSVFHIKSTVLAVLPQRRAEYRRMRGLSIAYHLALLALIAGLIGARRAKPFLLAAFLPILARTTWSLLRPPVRLDLKRMGVLEIVYSLAFLFFAAIALRAT